jgi:ATP synthase subunit b, mitochondrial
LPLLLSLQKQRQGWHDWREGSIKFLENYIKMKEENNQQMQNSAILFDAKRENILLQQEAEYRRRSMKVYKEALKKLNYQIALEDARKAFSHKHMVNWIIDSVYKSITPQQQKVIFDQCLADLKALASKKQGSL